MTHTTARLLPLPALALAAALVVAGPAVALGLASVTGGSDPRAAVDVDGLSLPRTIDAANPVSLAIDGADLAARGLASHNEEGFEVGMAPFAVPVAWFPGAMDDAQVHGGYFLDFTQPSDAIAEQLAGAYADAARGTPLPQPGMAMVRTMPRVLADVDVPNLALDARLETAVHDAAELAGAAGEAGIGGLDDAAGAAGGMAVRDAAWLPPPGVDAPLATHATPAVAGPKPIGPFEFAFPDFGVALLPDMTYAAGAAMAAGVLLLGALYHLVNRENIFENDMRTRIYELVAQHPGMTIGEVAREVGLSAPTVRYHITMLQKNQLLTAIDQGNRILLFRNRQDFDARDRELVALLRSPEAMRVYDAIAAKPWILRKELAEQLGISRTSVNWHLRTLMKCALVDESREQGRGFLFASREGKAALQSVAARSGHGPAPAALPVEASPPPLTA